MSSRQFNSDINYYLAIGLLDETLTVFSTQQSGDKEEKHILFLFGFFFNNTPEIQFADKM